MKKQFHIGQRVKLLVDKVPYYAKPDFVIPAGSIGVVGATDVPGVYSGRYFTCVDFNSWRVSAYQEEIVPVNADDMRSIENS